MGLCLTIANALTSASCAWVLARMPQFGQMIARRDWAALDRLFWRSFRQSGLILIVVATVVWTAVIILQGATGDWVGDRMLKIGNRLLPALPLGLILIGTLVQHTGFTLCCYLRAHRRDPFARVFIALGICTAAAAFAAGRAGGGTLCMAAIYLGINVLFYLGWGVAIFVRSRRNWHAEPPAAQAMTDLNARDIPRPTTVL
jgi:O-antigen/teichoic acid export membrane protein